MHLQQINNIVLGTLVLCIGSVIPAQAASVPGPEQIVISHTVTSKGYELSLTIQLDRPVSAPTASQTGSASLEIKGSFYSARCANLSVCG